MRRFLVFVSLFLIACSPSWEESPYEVYYIDGTKTLGYSLGEGGYIGRIDEPVNIKANEKFISVYACPYKACGFYYIDKIKDHKFAEHDEFVFGPYTNEQFIRLVKKLGLPSISSE
ncbi:hypothetical protein L1285_23460 [Pseudoalteromonas sp. DL2-H2.2]|uniref:hypothetical protein n=1 Tax=Pseudoalteromonas sp. DL2-H2.2 TaxID=2908889 RepID=UPI001F247A57|nr:hypothetical protein [Pseudoalteromonas sp. DL2-H2.2]MCF2911255.1 hypothetical protein [Pseudoalteromonas sp. DL2-H2.2]